MISEFMATNVRTLTDARRRTPDWIELHNRSDRPVNLEGWGLTDRLAAGTGSAAAPAPKRWLLPAVTLGPDERRLVFASGRDQRDPAAPLHTDFKLSGEGEYLALIRPDGSVATRFAPKYPAQHADVSFGFAHPDSPRPWFLPSPTPGKPNGGPEARSGPILEEPSHSPSEPKPGEPVRVAVRVTGNPEPVKAVRGFWRAQFRSEQALDLNDAGREGDEKAGDGVWSGTIPTAGVRDGSLLRWRFEATDSAGGASRWPLFPDRERSGRYLGTVMNAGAATSALPVFHLFIEPSKVEDADSEEGARGALWFDGELYDNILVKVRGNSTQAFPKKSHRIEFTHEHLFRHPGPGGRIRKTSLMAEWGDPTYLRQHLSFWLATRAGVAAPFHDPVRVQLNGEFWQLAMHSQVLGEELLERTGLDPDGALYKAVGTLTPGGYSTGGTEKKTRRWEGERELEQLAVALGRSAPEVRARELFDRCDLPAVINYLAVARLTQEDDDIWANLSLYRDNEGSGRWRPVAFDMNVSWGFSFAAGGILADRDNFRSHPFWGADGIGNNQGHNGLYDAVIRTPATREMLVRRMRTLMDRDWLAPGTPMERRVIEGHIEDLRRRMAPEAALDRRKWGLPWTMGRVASPEQALDVGIQDLVRRFIEPRRIHFFVTHSATNAARRIGVGHSLGAGIPGPQPSGVLVRIADWGWGPESRQDWMSLSNTNAFAVDVSDWALSGDIRYTLPPGTVIPSGSRLYVAASEAGFLQRNESPKKGEGLLMVGGYKGRLSGGRIELWDAARRRVDGR